MGFLVRCSETKTVVYCILTIHGTRIIFQPSTSLQTTISVQFKPVSSVTKYELEWKLVQQEWASGALNTTLSAEGKMVTGEATDLEPGMTYCVRAACLKSDGSKGSPGPELILDTEQVGCTPKAEKSCCVIQ